MQFAQIYEDSDSISSISQPMYLYLEVQDT